MWRCATWPLRLLVVLLVTALTASLLAVPAGADGAQDRRGRGSRDLVDIETPTSRSTVTSFPVPVTVSIAPRVDPSSLRAWLNGRDVTARFGVLQDGKRTAALTYDDGLSFSRNRLTVAVRDRGRFLPRIDVDTARFTFEPELLGAAPVPTSVPIDSRVGPAANGRVKVRVGTTLYEMPQDLAHTDCGDLVQRGVWLLYLDRATLELRDDQALPICNGDQLFALEQAIQAHPTDTLVIANTFLIGAEPGRRLPDDLFLGRALTVMGTSTQAGLATNINEIALSAIGVPDLPPGAAYERNGTFPEDSCTPDASGTCRTGSTLSGTLQKDSSDNYAFVPESHVRYDTRAGTDPRGNTVRIGAATYVAPPLPADAHGGFHLLVLNRTTLAPMPCGALAVCNETYVTNAADVNTSWQNAQALANRLLQFQESNGELLVVTSIGAPLPLSTGGTSQVVRLALAAAVERIGGTYDTIVDLTSEPYSFMGSGFDRFISGNELLGVEPLTEAESSTLITAPGHHAQPGRLVGIFERGHQWIYEPAIRAIAPGMNFEMYDILDQPPTAWPLRDTLPRQRAVAYVTHTLCNCPITDVRLQYSDRALDFGQYANDLRDVSFPAGSPGFTQADLDAVKAQLALEFGHVVQVSKLFDNIASLTASAQAPVQTMIGQVAQEVRQAAAAPADPVVSYEVVEAVADVLEIAALFGGEEFEFIAVIGSLLELAWGVAYDDEGKGYDELEVRASALENELIGSFDAAAKGIANAFDAIVTDWGRLQRLGHNLTSATEGGPWYWGADTQDEIVNALRVGLRRHYYEAMLPAVQGLLVVKNSPTGDPAKVCGAIFGPLSLEDSCPFTDYPLEAYSEAPRTGDPRLELRFLAAFTPDDPPFVFLDDVLKATPPPAGLLGTLTGTPDGRADGPLGVYKPWIFRHWDFTGVRCDGDTPPLTEWKCAPLAPGE
jgi:hypothetical protein